MLSVVLLESHAKDTYISRTDRFQKPQMLTDITLPLGGVQCARGPCRCGDRALLSTAPARAAGAAGAGWGLGSLRVLVRPTRAVPVARARRSIPSSLVRHCRQQSTDSN